MLQLPSELCLQHGFEIKLRFYMLGALSRLHPEHVKSQKFAKYMNRRKIPAVHIQSTLMLSFFKNDYNQ